MSESTMVLISAVIGSGAATALVNGIIAVVRDRNRNKTGESQGLRWLLKTRLEQMANGYIADGRITYDELKNWNVGHDIFHNLLGGNGDLNALKEKLKSMYMRGENTNDS